MRKYELLAVLPGTLEESASKVKGDEIAALLKEGGAEEVAVNALGKNRLAYPIKQIRYGYFYTFVFACEPEKLAAIRGKMALLRDLLRTVLSHYDEKAAPVQKISLAETAPAFEEGEVRIAPERVMPEAAAPAREEQAEKPIDLKDIDKKLDEILSDESLVSGV